MQDSLRIVSTVLPESLRRYVVQLVIRSFLSVFCVYSMMAHLNSGSSRLCPLYAERMCWMLVGSCMS